LLLALLIILGEHGMSLFEAVAEVAITSGSRSCQTSGQTKVTHIPTCLRPTDRQAVAREVFDVTGLSASQRDRQARVTP